MSAGGQDIYTTQRISHEAKIRQKDRRIAELETEIERLTKFWLISEEYGNVCDSEALLANARIAELESDDHEWYLQAERIAELEAAIKAQITANPKGSYPCLHYALQGKSDD